MEMRRVEPREIKWRPTRAIRDRLEDATGNVVKALIAVERIFVNGGAGSAVTSVDQAAVELEKVRKCFVRCRSALHSCRLLPSGYAVCRRGIAQCLD